MPQQGFGEYRVKYDVNEMAGQRGRDGHAVKQIFFTRKDNTLYAITPGWPGDNLVIKDVEADKRSTEVTMLGVDEPLAWTQKRGDIIVELPRFGPGEGPCEHAWTIKLTHIE